MASLVPRRSGVVRGQRVGTFQPARMAPARPHPGCRAARPRRLRCAASAEAEQLLQEGKGKYEAKDRMGALRMWEQALDQEPTQQQRKALLWNAACVHASFGDVELAQIPLKEAIFGGLDFAAAVGGADPAYVKLQASAQVLIQLRRFHDGVQKARKAAAAAPSPPPRTAASAAADRGGGGGAAPPPRRRSSSMLGRDLSDALQTESKAGLDASVLGIVRRVVLLLVALSGLGCALFYLGLKYAFVDTPY